MFGFLLKVQLFQFGNIGHHFADGSFQAENLNLGNASSLHGLVQPWIALADVQLGFHAVPTRSSVAGVPPRSANL